MSKRQLALLFTSNLVMMTVGGGIASLAPVYAIDRLGADPGAAGLFMSFAFFGLAAGTLAAGWLSDRFQHRKVFFTAITVVDCVVIWLMGRLPTFTHLAVVMALDWFLGGIALTMLSILAGLFAAPSERGRVFGILSLTGSLGALLSMGAGVIVDWQGYRAMFTAAALASLCNPLVGLLLKDKTVARSERKDASSGGWLAGLGGSFFLLLAGRLAATAAQFVGALSRTLVMDEMGFTATEITSAAAVGGAVALGLSLLAGWLSDRVGRKWLLAVCYFGGAAGLVVLVTATSLAHFWTVAILLSLIGYVASGIGSALVTDLVPQESLGRGLSLFSAMGWIGGIVGYASTGYAIEGIGLALTMVAGALVTLAAVALLVPIHVDRG
ncbi:MAG: MFS transporter [Anaerolineae bacterium]|nr:MFS transporter [Anaerolineae bacterium]